jgi:hypothetical protein
MSLCRYVPFLYPGAGRDETASNCIFVCYFLSVVYTSTSTVWILALRPVLSDLSPPSASAQSARTASMYIKVKEDLAGNWSLGVEDAVVSPRNATKLHTDIQKPVDLPHKQMDAKAGRSREAGSSFLGNCCGGRREVSSSLSSRSPSQDRSSRSPHNYEATRRRDDLTKDPKTLRNEDATPAVLASSVLVRRSAANTALGACGPPPPDDYVSRDLARSSAAIGWGGINASPRIAGVDIE